MLYYGVTQEQLDKLADIVRPDNIPKSKKLKLFDLNKKEDLQNEEKYYVEPQDNDISQSIINIPAGPALTPVEFLPYINANGEEKEDEDKLDSCYVEELNKALKHVHSLSTDYIHHFLVTDLHYNSNTGKSLQLINKLLESDINKNAFSYIMVLGDLTDMNGTSKNEGTSNEIENFKKDFNPIKEKSIDILFAMGNHDLFDGSPKVYQEVSNYCSNGSKSYDLVKYFYGDDYLTTNNIDSEPDNYRRYYHFYKDNKKYKIRYIILNTNDDNSHSQTSVVTFLKESLDSMPSDYSAMVLGHRDLNIGERYSPAGGYGLDPKISGGRDLDRGIQELLKSYGGNKKIIGYFCGHQHVDYFSNVDNKFYHNTFLNDKFEFKIYYPGDSLINRPSRRLYDPYGVKPTKESIFNFAFTIVSVNPTTGDTQFYRVGASNLAYLDKKIIGGYNYKTMKKYPSPIIENNIEMVNLIDFRYGLLPCRYNHNSSIESVEKGQKSYRVYNENTVQIFTTSQRGDHNTGSVPIYDSLSGNYASYSIPYEQGTYELTGYIFPFVKSTCPSDETTGQSHPIAVYASKKEFFREDNAESSSTYVNSFINNKFNTDGPGKTDKHFNILDEETGKFKLTFTVGSSEDLHKIIFYFYGNYTYKDLYLVRK